MNTGEISATGSQVQGATEVEVQTPEEVALIDGTIESIRSIFNKGVTETYIEIGTLIVEKIYNNKLDEIDFSKGPGRKNNEKHLLFRRLAEEIDKRFENGEALPQKTWLYNSVRLVADQQLLRDCKEYEKLNISHKIALLRLNNKNEKIEIINRIVESNLSVRGTRDLLDKKPNREANDLKSIIDDIENIPLFEDLIMSEFDGLTSKDPSVKPALKAGKRKIRQIERELDSCRKMAEKYKKTIEDKESLKSMVELIIEKLERLSPGGTGNLKTRKRKM